MHCPDFIGCEVADGDSAVFVIDCAESYGIAVDAYSRGGVIPRIPFRFEALTDGSVRVQVPPVHLGRYDVQFHGGDGVTDMLVNCGVKWGEGGRGCWGWFIHLCW